MPAAAIVPALARTTAENLAHAACFIDEISITDDDGANRGAESFAQADANTVRLLHETGGGDIEGDGGIPEARTVHMEFEAVAVCHFASGVHVFYGQATPSATIVRVFDGQQTGTRVMLVIGADRRHHKVKVQRPIRGGGQRAGMDPSEYGGAALLGRIDVGLVTQDQFVAATAVAQNRGQIAHRAAGHKQSGLFSEQVRSHRLETIDGRVFAVYVISDWRRGHRLTHFIRGVSHGIGAQIDRFFSQNSYLSSCELNAIL